MNRSKRAVATAALISAASVTVLSTGTAHAATEAPTGTRSFAIISPPLLAAGAQAMSPAACVVPDPSGRTCTEPRQGWPWLQAPERPGAQIGTTSVSWLSTSPTSQESAPKPSESTKKWRDYILGNKKPPIRPKP